MDISSHVKLVPLNLRPEETVEQISEALEHLLKLSTLLFSQVGDRIDVTRHRVEKVTARAKSVQSGINQLAGSQKALKVFSSAAYPVPENKSFGFSGLILPNVPSIQYTQTKESKPYPPIDERKLQEKLNFYHIGTPEKRNGSHTKKNNSTRFRSLSEAFFYSSNSISTEDYDIISSGKWPSCDEDIAAPLLGEAPPSIVRRGRARQTKVDDLHYYPQVPELPEMELPLALPDLPGIAEDFDSEILAPTFAPVLSLPDLSSLMVQEEGFKETAKFEETEVATSRPPEKGVADSFSPAQILSMEAPPPPPPPPLPFLPSVEEPVAKKSADVVAAVAELDSGATLDMHGSLMDAIRKAGGKAKLKTASGEIEKGREGGKQPPISSTPKSAGPGDLMADLMAKLSTRRKGISGSRQQASPVHVPTPPGGVLGKISSLIPPPPIHPNSEEGDDGFEDPWND